MASSTSTFKIAAGLLAIYLIWGSTYLAIRIAVETLPPFLMAGSRFLIAGSLLSAILVVQRRFRANTAQWLRNAHIGLWLLLGGNGLVTWAEQTVPSGLATLIAATNPIMIVAAEALIYRWTLGKLGQSPGPRVLVGIVLGIVGLVILVAPSLTTPADATTAGQVTTGQKLDGQAASAPEEVTNTLPLVPHNIVNPLGIAAILIACFAWTVGSEMSRYAHDPVEPFTGAAIQMLSGGMSMLLLGLLLGEHTQTNFSGASARSISAWLYLIFAGSLIAFTTFVWLMKYDWDCFLNFCDQQFGRLVQ